MKKWGFLFNGLISMYNRMMCCKTVRIHIGRGKIPCMSKVQNLIKISRERTQPVIAVVAGSGLVVCCAVEAGADLLMVLNAGLYRNLGTGSLAAFLPYGNANDQTEMLLREQVSAAIAGCADCRRGLCRR